MNTKAASRRWLPVDLVVLSWVVVWVVVGLQVGANLREMRQVGDTLETTSQAVDLLASGLRPLSNIPLAGASFDEVADTLENAAVDVATSADVTRSSLHELSILLALAIAVIPNVPVLAAYLPYRRRQSRPPPIAGG